MKYFYLLFFCPLLLFSQTQIGQDIDGESIGDEFGQSVSMNNNGTIVAVGGWRNDDNGDGSGHVRVFEDDNGIWNQIGNDIIGEEFNNFFGTSVSLNYEGNRIAIGAIFNDGNGSQSGHVRVFEEINGVWTQIGNDIDGESSGDLSGRSVSLNYEGNRVAIGANFNDGNGFDSGHVRIYEESGGIWMQVGMDIDGESPADFSGRSVSLNANGNRVAIGATNNNGSDTRMGHVRVFEETGGVWTQIGSDINGEANLDFSGRSVSLNANGTRIAIDATFNDGNGADSGHVRVFEETGGVWTQIGSDINGESLGDQSGESISLSSDGTIIAIGAPFNDGNGDNSGHVRVYKESGGTWTQVGLDINGENLEDQSGKSVSVSLDGTIIAIGAPFNDGNGDNSGHVRVYDLGNVLSVQEQNRNTFSIYPNPTKSQFTVQLNDGNSLKQIEVYTILGELLITSKKTIVNTSKLSTGTYLVKIKTSKGTAAEKLIIE
ncbi:T9SS type A sorting domain-containing protein [Ichthyenterobacterium sp. W332]|uniref:T9SS type A sorting domain-containing protein n=1 Tax=Microcosmobacter mediterraneus TaxID=3075607 RepID=A0ABU2YIN3_9FLAO|nr:T9SS type A sorting domain-containing protein [Ichthyenterobacterium sp. W332]MDT0558016.1 T9SS type A sorting domain-containing protein [Ichthyenterobacterium sp. W332]